ncbi:MAG: hypothetical protein EOP06_00275 [Proteobacteria bacterium]|nr:MAG: hypothetical protein EOP06_00275 [Pseudomonadota bacterium]
MNTFYLKFGFAVSIMLAFAPLANGHVGGSIVGDGGHAVVCRTSKNTETAVIADFFEAEQLYGYLGEPSQVLSQRLEDALEQALSSSNAALGEDHGFSALVRDAKLLADESKTIFLSDRLSRTPDLGSFYAVLGPRCGLEQAAVFTEAGDRFFLRVNAKIWSQLSNLNRAGLLIHEALHLWFPKSKNNAALRQAVSYLFAPQQFRTVNASAFRRLIESRQRVEFSVTERWSR